MFGHNRQQYSFQDYSQCCLQFRIRLKVDKCESINGDKPTNITSLCTLFNPWQRMPPSRLKMGSGLKLGKCSALNNLDFSISHILTTAYPMRSTKLQLPTQSSTRCCMFKDLKTFCCFNASSVIQAKKNHRHKLISDKPQPAELSRYKVWGIIFPVLMSPQCPRAAAGVTLPPSLSGHI